jgi:polysaccharide deacetylase family protein (PEP-CTERM system associated)
MALTTRTSEAASSAPALPPPAVVLRSRRPASEPICEPVAAGLVKNVFTVDLEDWPIAVLGPDQAITDRVVANTQRCLEILHSGGVRATFFVLSKVAERFPDLIREVHAAGHEIASHGHGHEVLTRLSPERFEADVRTSIEILTDIIGERPLGYRAPAFSIVASTRWAGPILSKLGFQYDSSIFPIHHQRYGISDAPRGIHRWPDCPLIECPPATVAVMGSNLPVAGGGYYRLLPGAFVRAAVRRINREQMPAVLYLHPYELDTGGIGAHQRMGVKVGPARHLTQAMFRGRIESRLRKLLEQFEFTTMRELVRSELRRAPLIVS